MKPDASITDHNDMTQKGGAISQIPIKSEERLAQALEEYAGAVEADHPLSKTELLARYADVSDELAGCLDSLDFIHQVAPQLGDGERHAKSNGESSIRPLATLGDFRIVRELGRGGMGVVYEAEQLSLGRRVALKVLPFAAMLGDQQVKRFHNEARAAATLDHPHIVAIHSVGTERGVHYYAMQLIEGRNLAEVIQQLRDSKSPSPPSAGEAHHAEESGGEGADTSPVAVLSTIPDSDSQEFFRMVARLGVQAAGALDHAHQQGIVHRDVKPGNLLVDAEGKLYVTDFGLAHIETDTGMTMTGDMLGTLRYMSPEQALAKRAVIDHRTDIYSLGITLYELFTLQPAFTGEDRQELLRQIAFEEPRKPRQINTRIPEDLETIVLNSMEKNPEDRYTTSQEFADDLERFLSDQPVLARPPNLPQQMVKWLRRNPTLVAASALVLGVLFVIAAVAAAVVAGAWGNARKAQQQTVVQRDRYLSERDQALRNLYVADIRLAHKGWIDGHMASYDQLLDRHITREGQPDNRDWEWYYLKSLGQRELKTLRGHTADVNSVSWSPDDRFIATSSDDSTLKIWDATTLRLSKSLHEQNVRLRSAVWSPNGDHIACSGSDGKIRIWNAVSSELMSEIPARFSGTTGIVAWSPDSTQIASCGISPDDGKDLVRIWNASNGQELQQMNGPDGYVWSIAWSPNGKQLASCGGYHHSYIHIWNADTGTLVREINDALLDGDATLWVAWSADGKRLASANREYVDVWDATNGQRLWRGTAHLGKVASVDWSPNGEALASVGWDGRIKLWDENSQIINELRGHQGGVTRIDWRSDGKRLATASVDGTVRIWDPAERQDVILVRLIGTAAWNPSERHTLITLQRLDEDRLSLKLLSGEMWTSEEEVPLPPEQRNRNSDSWLNLVEWSPDAKQFAIKTRDDDAVRVSVIERATGAIVASWKESNITGENVWDLAWNPVAPMLAMAKYGDGAVVRDVTSAATIVDLGNMDANAVAWSPDGSQLAVFSFNQQIAVYDARTWREIVRLDLHPNQSIGSHRGGMAWSSDGSILAAGSARGLVILWNTSTWRERLSFSAHTAAVNSVAFSPDDRRLATTSTDLSVKVWDIQNGDHLLTLRSLGYTAGVAWSPDGTCLLCTGGHWARIWDASAAMEAQQDIAK